MKRYVFTTQPLKGKKISGKLTKDFESFTKLMSTFPTDRKKNKKVL
ncbi:hypothetical protein [Citrobacter phage CVT22]|uniref:Uncharacterized protein n=1 Tax=Citrobacter phage CVT22 TaxID=1622234 RepID=A0A0R6CIV6_9CAUD|nr:hypothetical protein APL39_gp20 [Citrobacter phage CVT22]AJT60724.1 hypothetical protein [Citrobacter phage CVT22]